MKNKSLAYVLSLVVLASAAWLPTSLFAQGIVCSTTQSACSSGSVSLNVQQTWTAPQIHSSLVEITNGTDLRFGAGAHGSIRANTSQTPDTVTYGTGTTANSLVITEVGDFAFDFAHALQTDPTLYIHSRNQTTTQWISLTHNGTDSVIGSGAGGVIFPANSLGWSIVAAANQVCTTTCTNAAVHGWDTAAGEVAVGPADATADKCLCAGPN